MFFGGEKFNYTNKNVSVLWTIYKQLNKRIFGVFSAIFVYFSANREEKLNFK